MNTDLRGANPSESKRNWDPSTDEWYNSLTPNEQAIAYDATTKEYAETKLKRNTIYNESAEAIADDSLLVTVPMAIATGIVAPETLIPGGFVFKQAKTAYTIGPKLGNLAQIAATSGIAAMASATTVTAIEQGTGLNPDADYMQANAWALGIGMGLPVFGKMMSSSYNIGKTAAMLSSSPQEFAVLSGEIALSKVPQAKSLYNKVAPDWLKSDVMITSESNNPYTTIISNRMDSPSVALVDRQTGKPVPIETTGQDFKVRMFGEMNLWKTDMNGNYQDAVSSGYVGSKDAYQVEVAKVLRLRANKQDMEVDAYINNTLQKEGDSIRARLIAEDAEEIAAIKKTGLDLEPTTTNDIEAAIAKQLEGRHKILKAEAYDNIKVDIDHENIGVKAGAQRSDDYFTHMREQGISLKSKEMQGINGKRNYLTRIFNYGVVRDLDEATLATRLGRAIGSHPGNIGIDTTEAGLDMAKKLKSLDYSREYADYSFLVPQEVGLTGFLKNRRYKFDESQVQDLLEDNIEDIVGQYTYKQSGHYAALHAFPELADVPLAQQAEVFRDTIIKPKHDADIKLADTLNASDRKGFLHAQGKENKALENMFNDMLGNFRIIKNSESTGWKFARLTNGWNSLTYGGGFALNTAAETGALLLQGNFTNVMKANMRQMSEIGTLFNGKSIKDPLVRDMILSGNLETLFEYKGMMRMADTESVFNADKIEEGMQKLNEGWYKWNGLRPATAALESLAGPKVIHDILDFGADAGLSLANEKYLARIGLSHDDAKKINTLLKKHGEFEGGGIIDLHVDKWGDDNMVDKLLTGISRGVKHTVIKGDTTYLPAWMIDPNTPMAPFTRLVTNFLRYPMAATETMLARGVDESAAKYVASIVVSAGMMGSVLYAREQAAIAAGFTKESDAKYADFLTDDESMIKLTQDVMMKVGSFGALTLAFEKGMLLSGNSMAGTEYVPNSTEGSLGPTLARLTQMQNVMKGLTSGDWDNKAMWYGIKGMTPFATYPMINEYSSHLIKENTR
jgi:hypothetical protein